MYTTGWIAIALEVLLLLIWIYHIFLKPNGTDPAGQGTAMVFLIGLVIYIGAGVGLMTLQKLWALILVWVMALLPLSIVIIGLLKNRNQTPTVYESSDPEWKVGSDE